MVQRKPNYRSLAWIAATLLLGYSPATASPASALSCEDCKTQVKLLSEHVTHHQTQSELLKRNRDYLATLTKDDVSKSIKVKSNILILMVRIETLRNNIESLKEETTTKLCKACERSKK